MRTPEEIFAQMKEPMPYKQSGGTKPYIIEAIELAQKEAYNEGVRDAAKNAKASWAKMDRVWVDKQSILKLLKL